MADEFSKAVEFTDVSEFAKGSETFISAPEFVPVPDEFAMPGTTDTSDNREKRSNNLKAATLYLAAAASVIMTIVASTGGFMDSFSQNGQNAGQPEQVDVPGIGTFVDIEGDETDPSIHVSMAKTDGKTLTYSYVVWLGQRMSPVSVHAAAFDAEGREANPEADPDIWNSSRDLFEYTIDVSELEGDITLVLTGTFDKEGEEGKIVKVVTPDDAALMPELEASVTSADPQGEWSTISYEAFFMINEEDPHMREYDLEVTSFTLNWYNEDESYMGGGAFVWEPDTFPDKETLASAPVYMFTYMGPAHTDLAPDEAMYFSVEMIVTDRSTGKRYTVDTEPFAIPSRAGTANMSELFADNPEWYNASTGEYLHFGSLYGFRKYNIDESVLFNRFSWEQLSDKQMILRESYYKLDQPHYDEYIMNVEQTDGSYRIIRLSDDAVFEPVASVDYDGYAYMYGLCDLDLVQTAEALNTFTTMFTMNGIFEISEIKFMAEGEGSMIPYGQASSSWWPGTISFHYDNPEPDNPLAAVIRLDIPNAVNTSANSTFTGVLTASIEYYGEGPMLVLRPDEGFVNHNTIMEWNGDPNALSTAGDETVYLTNTLADPVTVEIEDVPEGETHQDTAIRMWGYYYSGIGTKLKLVRTEKIITGTQESDDSLIIRDEDAPQENWYVARGEVTNTYRYIYHYEIS